MEAFDGKVALVTGASSGIGAATAIAFARAGARVVLAARREEKAQQIVQQIESLGAQSLFVKTDVSKPADIENLIASTLSAYGRLDCAVNNAGIAGPINTPVAEIEDEDWDAVMNTNLRGVWQCMKHEIRAMLTHGKGAIVNVASVLGYRPSDLGQAPYCAAKHGLIGLSKSAAADYAQQGIRINVVAPGFTRSEIVDPFLDAAPKLMKILLIRYSSMNRVGEADEVADAIVWLCSDASRFVIGAVLPVDGGEVAKLY